MNQTDTETTLCSVCGVPMETPKPIHFGPFVAFQPEALCKDCYAKAASQQQLDDFHREHVCACPYKKPTWRPMR